MVEYSSTFAHYDSLQTQWRTTAMFDTTSSHDRLGKWFVSVSVTDDWTLCVLCDVELTNHSFYSIDSEWNHLLSNQPLVWHVL